MLETGKHLGHALRLFYELLWLVKPGIAIVLVFALFTAGFSQSTELLRHFLDGQAHWASMLWLLVSLLALASQLYFFSQFRIQKRLSAVITESNTNPIIPNNPVAPDAFPNITSITIVLLVIAPFLFVALTLGSAGSLLPMKNAPVDGARSALLLGGDLLVMVFAAIAVYFGVHRALARTRLETEHFLQTLHLINTNEIIRTHEGRPHGVDEEIVKMLRQGNRMMAVTNVGSFAILLCVWVFLSAFIISAALQGEETIPPLAILYWMFVLATSFYAYFDVLPIPEKALILTSLVTASVLFHTLFSGLRSELRGHHLSYKELRTGSDDLPQSGALRVDGDQVLATAFREWLRTRPGIEKYRREGRRYPVFVVTAQGGALAAAYHAGLALARWQDLCPAFASHVFAISAVSGGSLGASTFSAAVNAIPEQAAQQCGDAASEDIRHVTAVEDMLKHDFVSSVLFTGLYIDLPLQFLGIRFVPFDRAVALEYTIENVWTKVSKTISYRSEGSDDYFVQPLSSTWKPAGLTPLVLYNATISDTGQPLLISSIEWDYTSKSGVQAYNLRRLAPHLEVAASTAIVLSARFPYISPAGYIRTDMFPPNRGAKAVDGG